MVEIICKRSGLTFEAENRRKSVHPQISRYTTHNDMDLRYAAISVIERGKAEGWATIEQFIAEIEKGEEKEPEIECDWDGAWLALITGSDEKYRFSREFVDAVRVEERGKAGSKFYRKFYRLVDLADGIYEGCYKSAKGNETRTYWRIESGVVSGIELTEVETLHPEIVPEIVKPEVNTVTVFGALTRGEIIEKSGQWYQVVAVEATHYNDDGEEVDGGDYAEICSTRHQSTLKPVTLKQITQWHLDGHNVGDAAILAANLAGHLGTSAAMNSDF